MLASLWAGETPEAEGWHRSPCCGRSGPAAPNHCLLQVIKSVLLLQGWAGVPPAYCLARLLFRLGRVCNAGWCVVSAAGVVYARADCVQALSVGVSGYAFPPCPRFTLPTIHTVNLSFLFVDVGAPTAAQTFFAALSQAVSRATPQHTCLSANLQPGQITKGDPAWRARKQPGW